MSDNNNKTNR